MSKNGKSLAKLIPHQDPEDRIDMPVHEISLWRVEGEESSDSSGGESSLYVLTDSPTSPPDCHRALSDLTNGRHAFYNLSRIVKVSDYVGMADDTLNGTISQTSVPIAPGVASLIGSLMREREALEEGYRDVGQELRAARDREDVLRQGPTANPWRQPVKPGRATENYSFGHVVCCPQCSRNTNEDFDMMHPTSVVVNRGGEITTVDAEGTRITTGSPDGRGVSISIGFCCECGRQSIVKFHFYKGQTYFTHTDVGDAPRYEEGECEGAPQFTTIWRD